MAKISIYAYLAFSGIVSGYTINNQAASQVLSREKRQLLGRSMVHCYKNKVCNYEEFAERAENTYGKAVFGEIAWHGSRKSGTSNANTHNAFHKLYMNCHQADPQCLRQKQSCKCFQDMIYYLQSGEYPGEITTTAEPGTTPGQSNTDFQSETTAPAEDPTTTGGETTRCWWC